MCILSDNTTAVAASSGDYNSQPMCMIVFMAMPTAAGDYIEPTGCENNFNFHAAQFQWPQAEGYPAQYAALGDEASQSMWQQQREGNAAAPFPQAWTDTHVEPAEGRCLPNELVEFQNKFGAAFPQIGYLMEAIWCGGEARESAAQVLLQPGAVRYYSFHQAGTRLIQLALETLDRSVAVQLASDLQGHVVRAMTSSHANYVIQKIIQVLRPSEVPFVVEEIRHAGMGLARHAFGCRVFSRLLEHGDLSTAALMDEVLANARELIKHNHGKYVIEVALEHGLPDQRMRILSELGENLIEHVFDANGSYVLQSVLKDGCPEQSEAMAAKLLALADRDLGAVAHNYFGCAVVRTAVESSGQFGEKLLKRFEASSLQWRLWSGKAGRRLRGILGVKSQEC